MRFLPWGVGVLLVVAWLLCFAPLLHAPPASRDALLWIQRGTDEQWLTWALGQRHFVGYRPLTALSFSVNDLLGRSAFAIRAVDQALFLCAGGMLFALARRWTGWWPAVVALAAYVLHPSGEEIIVDVARRSYSLSAVLGLGGLLCIHRRWCAVALLTAAVLCNEMAIVLLVLAPWFARSQGSFQSLRAGWPHGLAVLLVVVVRLWVLRGSGGYDGATVLLPWLAGAPVSEAGLLRPLQAALAGLYQTLLPVSGAGQLVPLMSGVVGLLVAVCLGVSFGVLLWRTGPMGRLVVMWFGATLLLAAGSVTWFWRMAYPAMLPMALAMAVLVHRRSLRHRLCAAVCLAVWTVQSPVVRGVRPAVADLVEHGQYIASLEQSRGEARSVLLLSSATKHRALSTARWLSHGHPDWSVTLLGYRKSNRHAVAEWWAAAPDTVKVHEDVVVTEAGAQWIVGPRLIAADALPEDGVLLWDDGAVVEALFAAPP